MNKKLKYNITVIAVITAAMLLSACSSRPENADNASSTSFREVNTDTQSVPMETDEPEDEFLSSALSVPASLTSYPYMDLEDEYNQSSATEAMVSPDAPIFILDSKYGPDIDIDANRYLAPSKDTDIIIDLSIPSAFNITRPLKKINTTYGSYFITGTSDPSIPVYFEGEEIERQGYTGVFGVHAELEMGVNIFTFSQGDEIIEVTIVREAEGKTVAIDTILQSSMFPAVQGGAKAGEALTARCIAPAGAVVTAEFGGSTARLVQAAQAQDGIPAVFSGKLSVGEDYNAEITEKIGPINYTLEYNGKKTVYESIGDVFVAGKDSILAVEVISYAGFVYKDMSGAYNFKEKVKGGARDYIVSQDNGYFELSSGGYIPVEATVIVEGVVKVSNAISSPTEVFEDSFEAYSFSSQRLPMYYTRISEDSFLITIYNTSGAPVPDASSSRLFSSVKTQREENGTTYEFTLKNQALLWGYDISFDDDVLTFKFRYKPKLSNNPEQPLSGIKVLLDPGHGGTDSGALGIPGETGPWESMINLAHTYIIRDRLEGLGATVYLTRADDTNLHLDSRLRMIDELDADIFLSVHHNSIGENADANKPSGMEVYYHTDFSLDAADSMMKALTLGVNRDARFMRFANYRVTLMPYAPSLLLELGFLSNPMDYEKMTNPIRMEQIADAVAEGLYRMFS